MSWHSTFVSQLIERPFIPSPCKTEYKKMNFTVISCGLVTARLLLVSNNDLCFNLQDNCTFFVVAAVVVVTIVWVRK